MESVAASLLESMKEKQRARQAFIDSTTFALMLGTLRDSPGARSVSTEDVSYHLEKTRSRMGWSFATEQDINDFMNVLGDPDARTVEGTPTVDPENHFHNLSYRHYGLNVFFMTGQGTFVSISNDAAKRQEETPGQPAPAEIPPAEDLSGVEDRPHGKNAKQMIVVRTDLEMDLGKIIGQAMHAVIGAVMLGRVYDPVAKTVTISVADPALESWLLLSSFKKIVFGVRSEAKLLALHEKAKAAGLRTVLIQDAGHTQFDNVPTYTALCIGPHWPEDLDPVTKRLQLLKTKDGKLVFD